MKQVTIYFKDKEVISFQIDIDDFAYIVEQIYTKYSNSIGFEIKDLEKVKKHEKHI